MTLIQFIYYLIRLFNLAELIYFSNTLLTIKEIKVELE